MVDRDRPRLSIVILNWNTADLLSACLGSIRRHVAADAEVIVVDNGSHDGSVERVRREFPHVLLIPLDSNHGFSRGNNIALERARGEFILLLNPDTEMRPGVVEALVDHFERTPRAGIAGPKLEYPDGRHQPSVALFPTPWIEFLRQTMLGHFLPTRNRAESRRDETRKVDMVTGAALCIRRECLEDIGPLDESLFMYYEDTDWCRRAWDAGWEVWYVTCPGLMHVKTAAGAAHARTRTLLDSQRSMIRYFEKHPGSGSVGALRVVTLCGSLLRILRAALLWVGGRNRSDQAARLRAHGRQLRWALTGGGL
jgi:GT2 family glycosyltransferase